MTIEDKWASIDAILTALYRSLDLHRTALEKAVFSPADILPMLQRVSDAVKIRHSATNEVDGRLEEILEGLYRLAALDYSTSVPPKGDGGPMDAMAGALNMLAEELAAAQTEAKAREENICDQNRLLGAILISMGEGIAVANESGQLILVNRAGEQMLGKISFDDAPREWPGKFGVYRLDGKTPFPAAELPLFRALRGKSVDDVEMVIDNPQVHGPVTVSASARPIQDETGANRGAVVVFRDITKAKRALTEIRRLASIVESTTDAIIGKDLAGTVTSWNRSASVLYGYSPEEAIGMPGERLAVDPQEFNHVLSEIRAGRIVTRYETARRRKDGSTVQVSLNASPVFDDRGQVVGFSGISHDISEQKRKDEELARAKLVAEEAARAKGEFLANMSHEIRTPLTAMLGFADLLTDRHIGESERINAALTVHRNGHHLLHLVNEILDLSKVEAGQLSVERMPFSPHELLVSLASLFRPKAIAKGIGFEMVYATPIPLLIQGDSTRVRQILFNIVSNALKFTEKGAVSLTVSLKNPGDSKELPRLVFEVTDTGIGIAPEKLSALFRPFSQADSSMTRRFGGTGLGLHISRLLADAISGSLEVRSAPGRGSTFILEIPTGSLDGVSMVADPVESGQPSHADRDFEIPSRFKGRVLVAEDGPDNQLLMRSLLGRRGLAVEIVENGQAAVERALAACQSSMPFDVVLMDIQMPVLDGYEATARLRAQGYSGPIVAVTAHAMMGERERCLAAGCNDYVSKPIEKRLLFRVLARYLQPDEVAGASPPSVPEAHLPEEPSGQTERMYSEYADDPEMVEAIARFVASLPGRIAEFEAKLEAGDRPELLQLSHKLRGAAGGFGFPAIGEASGRLEFLLKESGAEKLIQKQASEVIRLCGLAGIRPLSQGGKA